MVMRWAEPGRPLRPRRCGPGAAARALCRPCARARARARAVARGAPPQRAGTAAAQPACWRCRLQRRARRRAQGRCRLPACAGRAVRVTGSRAGSPDRRAPRVAVAHAAGSPLRLPAAARGVGRSANTPNYNATNDVLLLISSSRPPSRASSSRTRARGDPACGVRRPPVEQNEATRTSAMCVLCQVKGVHTG